MLELIAGDLGMVTATSIPDELVLNSDETGLNLGANIVEVVGKIDKYTCTTSLLPLLTP